MLTLRSYETISDLMALQDQIDAFQKLVFSHFNSGTNNECRISSLVPLVQESYGIYKFITSMLRAMHTSTHSLLFTLCVLRGSMLTIYSYWRRRSPRATSQSIRRPTLSPCPLLLRMFEPALSDQSDHHSEAAAGPAKLAERRR